MDAMDHPLIVPKSTYDWMKEAGMIDSSPPRGENPPTTPPFTPDPDVLIRWAIPPPGMTWAQWLEATCRRALRQRWLRGRR